MDLIWNKHFLCMHTHESLIWIKQTHPEYIIYISINNWPVLLVHSPFQHSPPPPPPPPHTGIVNEISIFVNDKIVYLQSKGYMPTVNWPLQSFSYFHLVVLLPVNIVSFIHMCLRTNIRGCKQFNMFMNENICTMIDLFNKAVEGAR